jgi:hypothetical protein
VPQKERAGKVIWEQDEAPLPQRPLEHLTLTSSLQRYWGGAGVELDATRHTYSSQAQHPLQLYRRICGPHGQGFMAPTKVKLAG